MIKIYEVGKEIHYSCITTDTYL